MKHKKKNSPTTKPCLCFNFKGFGILPLVMLITIVIHSLYGHNVAAKSLQRVKKNLKLWKDPSSLIQVRYKRDAGPFTTVEGDYDEGNYDVLPDQISPKAEQFAESIRNMWQSLTDSVRHCIDALRAMFGEDGIEEELTPEQEQQILAEMEERYRSKQQHDNEVIMNVYEYKL